jgi:hypothetical protein
MSNSSNWLTSPCRDGKPSLRTNIFVISNRSGRKLGKGNLSNPLSHNHNKTDEERSQEILLVRKINRRGICASMRAGHERNVHQLTLLQAPTSFVRPSIFSQKNP